MIQFKSLRQYTHVVNGIRFPNKPGQNFVVTYFSENSSLLEDYSFLNLKLIDLKINIVPFTTIPRTRLTPTLLKSFKKLGLNSYQLTNQVPSGRNVIYDLSQFLNAIDYTYNPSNYRQRLNMFIKNITNRSFSEFNNFEKVLLYSINLTKDKLNNFIDRKFFPIVQQLKDDSFSFDHLILCLITPSGPRYRLLVKNRSFKFERIVTILKTIKLGNTTEEVNDIDTEEENNAEKLADEVVNNIQNNILPNNKDKVKDAIKNYLSKDNITKEKVISKEVSPKSMKKIGVASILYKVTGDLDKSKKITNNISDKNFNNALKTIDKRYSDQMLQTQKPINTSTDNFVKSYDTPKAVIKSPYHLFQKRLIDFDINLQKDLANSFKVLETKELPLKDGEIQIVNRKQKNGEIEKSDTNIIKTVLTDKDGNNHNIQIEIPRIDPKTGTFRVNGQKKCLINQIVLCPITFPKKFESRFESSYSIFRIRSKRTRNTKYLEIFIANSWLPLSILLFYSFGFEETLSQYGIKYRISSDKPNKTDTFYSKIDGSNFIYFDGVNNELKAELINSFINTKVDTLKIKKPFATQEYFNDIIIKISGGINSTFLILSNLENIVDPVAKQVLINMHQPSVLKDIIYYMSFKVITGFVQDRNDILNQRIRGSEVLVHLIQKQILAAYTIYKQQILAGNKNAKFEINQSKLLSEFIRSEIVANMEYANPIEEMAVMTRISPVGKSIGGIPDKRAIQNEARNIHPSYFGNIDPLDTPEGEMIGISQQLAIGASISSARGLFSKKPFLDSEKSGILSTSSNMIPFIENNDGARIIMATNQAKQTLPLKNPEPPVVRSGYESLLTNILSNNFIKKSPCNGKVLKITDESIFIMCRDKSIREISIIPVHLKSGIGKDTLSIFKVIVIPGQIVLENQIIAEGSSISNGTISLGRTLCTAVMPYRGYNFEDGIVINENLINQDKLTSIHGIIDEVLISENDRVLEIAKIGTYLEKGKPILRKTIGEIEQLLGFSEEEGEEVMGQQFIKKSPGGRIVDIDVFSNLDNNKFPILKDLIERTRRRFGTTPTEKFSVKGNLIQGILIRFKIEQELRINLGDKLANRYGAKGIISLVEPNEMMPRTPWGDYVDIVVNPVGIIGRSNIGQLYELYCGLISREIGQRIRNSKSKNQILTLMKSVYTILDASKNKEFSTRLIANIAALSEREFLILVNQIKTTGFSPIIIPPFQAPKQDQIKMALTILGLKPGYNLFLPYYGTKTKSEVPVGYMYFSALEHKADAKVYGRSTGPVTGKTLQPTSGKSREGGQRLGEADTYSLISYNCPTLLSELMGPLSDDLSTKNEIISEIIQTGSAKYRDSKISPAKDLLNSYFVSLILERT
jgi:DNA-directed RNA polymerase beta subunit